MTRYVIDIEDNKIISLTLYQFPKIITVNRDDAKEIKKLKRKFKQQQNDRT